MRALSQQQLSVDPLDPVRGLSAVAERAASVVPGARAAAAILVDFDGSIAAWGGTLEPELVHDLSARLGRSRAEARLSARELPSGASRAALWAPLCSPGGFGEVVAGGLVCVGDERDLPARAPAALVELAASAASSLVPILELRAAWYRHDHLSWPGLRRVTAHWREAASERGETLWLALWAVDGLAQINRERGRHAGDRAAAEAAEFLATRLPGPGFFSRLPGAHFAGLCAGDAAFERLEPILVEGRERLRRAHGVELRLGLAAAPGSDAPPAEALVNRAAIALSAARRTDTPYQHWRADLPIERAEGPDLQELDGPTYRRIAAVWSLFDALTAGPELDDLLGQTLDAVAPLVGADRASVWMCGDGDGWCRQSGGDGEGEEREEILDAVRRREVSFHEHANPPTLIVPVPCGGEPLAAFFFAGASMLSGRDTFSFLVQLADQVGKVLRNRATLEGELRRQREAGARLRRQTRQLRQMLRSRAGLLGNSPGLREALRRIERASATRVPVLITGETGTGKEVAARMIHRQSKRDGPLIVVDCGAIPGPLLESDLFGHEAGAFTGAKTRKIGRFEQARGGTLFLDEIGELPLELQPKLLRVLQESTIRRVGGSDEIHIDFRLIAATHRDLARMVKEGAFREDLFFRLSVMEVGISPLRERGDDILLLAHAFLREHCAEMNRELLALSPAAEARLLEHSWPGNVRELQNVLHRAAIMAQGRELTPEDLALGAETTRAAARATEPPVRPMPADDVPRHPEGPRGDLEEQVASWLWDVWAAEETPPPPTDAAQSFLLRSLLAAANGNLGRVAELLSTTTTTINTRLKRLSHPSLTRTLRSHPLADELQRRIDALIAPGQGAQLLDELEDVLLRELFVLLRGNKSKIARSLGWSRQTLATKLDKLRTRE